MEKGSYNFTIRATDTGGGTTTLPITIEVTEQGTFRTELESDQPSMEGNADSSFKYQLTLRNRTADEQLFALSAAAPRGWGVDFEVSAQKVTSVKVDANASQNINVTIDPPAEIEAGTHYPRDSQAGSFRQRRTGGKYTGIINGADHPTGRLAPILPPVKRRWSNCS